MLRTYRWQQLRAALLNQAARDHAPCAICGHPIDYTLPGTHPNGPTLDHTAPRATGGNPWDETNLRPAHARCNSRRGAKLGAALANSNRPRRAAKPAQPSRIW